MGTGDYTILLLWQGRQLGSPLAEASPGADLGCSSEYSIGVMGGESIYTHTNTQHLYMYDV